MDRIAKLEVLFNILNSVMTRAYASMSTKLSNLQRMQYHAYHTVLTVEEIDEMIAGVVAIRDEIELAIQNDAK